MSCRRMSCLGVTHRPGFRVPSVGSAKAGLMDSIRSINPNARLNYAKGLTIEVPDGSAVGSGGPESLAAGLPPGHNFLSSLHLHHQQAAPALGAGLMYGGGGSGGIPLTPHSTASLAALTAAASGGLAVPPYVPVPVPVPYMMPPTPHGGGVNAAGGSMMGYLLPYQQDMYQALMDRLTTPRTSFAGSRSGRRTSISSVHTPRMSEAGPYGAQQYGSVSPATGNGNGFGAVSELERIVTNDPAPSGYTYVVPRAALGQLINRVYPGLRDRERAYLVGVLAACLPYKMASYTEDDVLHAVRQGAAIERAVQERRLPGDMVAVAARLADDVMGNAATYGTARTAFQEADRFRRGYLPLTEAARMLTRLNAVPPTAVAWLMAGLAHYAATALQGAADLSYKELGAGLLYMSDSAATAAAAPSAQLPYYSSYDQKDSYAVPPDSTTPYPSPFTGPHYPVQQPPYGAGGPSYGAAAPSYVERYPSLSSVPSMGTAPPQSPGSYDSRYPLSPRVSYSGPPPPYGSPHPYNHPPNPYGGPPSPHGVSPNPYSAYPMGPYGSPPLSPHVGSLSYPGMPPPPPPHSPYGSYTAASHIPVATALDYPTAPLAAGGGPAAAAGLSLGTAYMMWTHDNRQAVVQKHLSEVLKGRVAELEVQKGALEKEAGLQTKILDLSNALLANETAQRDVLGLIQSYTGAGTPPVSVAEMVGRIRTTLEEALQLAKSASAPSPLGGPGLGQGASGPSDFDSLLDALTNARWVGGQPVSTETLRTALSLRRDAFALRRAHTAAMLELEARRQGMQVASQEAQQAMSIQLQLLQLLPVNAANVSAPYSFMTGSRAPSTGGLPPAIYPAPLHD
ncbi:hypothetical protein VOLCADRAFT_108330 [Volvox carteri f. nagariensis]|uniref:Uncharacterized protein n=1 Tax=Volvox carteri f. nagariensis TaxID=3068 RepID=D8UJI0_VOLCA|nr:uncharacterized protein VOLCADRAFT_108330 [Volvox carteri f. nagariensis]EFJ40113.1 hypothetical protein VOLCADRAFT_108330 [Volvox carteri f. nagariensis]|eukprot:XP_002958809.1 hypothetical protein VOLCADRAFT_108330 [Volvox carteri f. nagariensis]